jgi:hypothetical protein
MPTRECGSPAVEHVESTCAEEDLVASETGRQRNATTVTSAVEHTPQRPDEQSARDRAVRRLWCTGEVHRARDDPHGT